MWTTPQATEMRFGFEVTMYVMNNNIHLYLRYVLRSSSFISNGPESDITKTFIAHINKFSSNT